LRHCHFGNRLLGLGLPAVASHAQALAVGHVVPVAAAGDRLDVVSVRLASVAAHAAALLALPRVTRQHGQPPGFVGLVAVATLVGVWPAFLPRP